uniref:Uncharacterized protein n=1 Tax=Cacopsylla melanoneura TaxID=428564 RepID=A0A8D8UJP6_9HEMI
MITEHGKVNFSTTQFIAFYYKYFVFHVEQFHSVQSSRSRRTHFSQQSILFSSLLLTFVSLLYSAMLSPATLLVCSAIIALCSGLSDIDPNDPVQKYHYDNLQKLLQQKKLEQRQKSLEGTPQNIKPQLQLDNVPNEAAPAPSKSVGFLPSLIPSGILPTLPSLPSLPSLSSFPEFEKGMNNVKNTAYDLGNNQIKNVFDVTGEVIKGTDQVLAENSNQIKRLNSANANMFKQGGRTVGSGLVKVPQVGTSVLSLIEDFFNHPFGFLNLFRPFTFLKYLWTLMPWYNESTEEGAIPVALKSLKNTNSALYYKLVDNLTTFDYFNKHPKAFMYLLLNPTELETYLNNPAIFSQLVDVLEKPVTY